jgi:A/G-specific adenine glycosylase
VVDFAQKLIRWQRRHGRRNLPWQGTRDPYRIWLAEVMLQQTRVAAVIPYYRRFLARFPGFEALAAASEEEVLTLWSGLGYYARGRNLLRAACEIVRRGTFPDTPESIEELPGVGPSTSAAIAVFAFGRRAAILDGNVRRVLARCFAVEGERAQWAHARRLLPARGIEVYTQAIMDLGATVCTRANPTCGKCPVAGACVALREGRVDELPSPRKRGRLPLRRTTWLVLVYRGSVLLERRPGSGLWGGLWTFPELATGAPAAYARKALGCELQKTRPLACIEHGFTHFRLRIRPILAPVARLLSHAASPGCIWLGFDEARSAAIPAPVRELLSALRRDQAL